MFKNIKKFYKRENFKLIYFGYVNAIRFNMPTVSIEKATLNFMKHHQLADDDFSLESAMVEYNRMAKEYLETEKTEN